MTRRERVTTLFSPDSQGISRWVTTDEVVAANITWTRNGNLRRGVAFGMDEYSWETRRRAGPRSAVTALRMSGFCQTVKFSQTIEPEVRVHFEPISHCNLSLLPIAPADREIDHRFGFKSHPKYVDLYLADNQTPIHFQLIHRSLNLMKRQMCKECVETRTRPAHPEKGFVEGGQELRGDHPCRGCFLAEPERYR
jgi:hypothetical protein